MPSDIGPRGSFRFILVFSGLYSPRLECLSFFLQLAWNALSFGLYLFWMLLSVITTLLPSSSQHLWTSPDWTALLMEASFCLLGPCWFVLILVVEQSPGNGESRVGQSAVLSLVGAKPQEGKMPPEICRAADFADSLQSTEEDLPLAKAHFATREPIRELTRLILPPPCRILQHLICSLTFQHVDVPSIILPP